MSGGEKMDEKRKFKRLPLELELNISELFKQDYNMIPGVNESIEVTDISKAGIGFICAHELPVGYYFDSKIQLPDKHFFSVIKIVRCEKKDHGYIIGCEFVGLADILSKSVDEYEAKQQ